MTEHQEQVAVITWFRYQHPKFAKCLWAIPNGGARHIVGLATLLGYQSVVCYGFDDAKNAITAYLNP
jgi:hypothetical protein